jgi:hypothetical protein
MTADMAFECVLVSRDPGVLNVMNRVLESLSISTNLCFTSSKAADRLSQGSADLIIVDWEDSSAELLRQVNESDARHRPTVVAVSDVDRPVPGAHLTRRKPVTREACTHFLRVAYTRMVRDHRRHTRYAVMSPVNAQDQNQRSVAVTVMDVGDGGVGLMSRDSLAVGDVLSFRLLLPRCDRSIYIEARVLWTRDYGAAGCEFLRIPTVDLGILHDWLKAKSRIKQPLVKL